MAIVTDSPSANVVADQWTLHVADGSTAESSSSSCPSSELSSSPSVIVTVATTSPSFTGTPGGSTSAIRKLSASSGWSSSTMPTRTVARRLPAGIVTSVLAESTS